jgi:hypothetical protein
MDFVRVMILLPGAKRGSAPHESDELPAASARARLTDRLFSRRRQRKAHRANFDDLIDRLTGVQSRS